MRYRFLIIGFVALLLHPAGAASAEEPRALLERAIQAHGGAEQLERTKKGHIKAKVESVRLNVPVTYEIEEWFDLPSRYKHARVRSGDGTSSEYVFTRKEAWGRQGTGPIETYPTHRALPMDRHWHAVLLTLLLLRNKDIQLKSLPEETKDGRTNAGFKATSSQASSDFFFDKSTGLLARTRRTTSHSLTGEDEIGDTTYEDYQYIQGVHYPMCHKVFTGKTLSSTVTLSFVEFGTQIDESVFLKPQTPAENRPFESEEQSPASRDRMLMVATVGAGIAIGAAWFIVRASKRGKRETPPS